MGQEIVYCFKCSSRIVSADLDKGSAIQIGNRTCCAQCLPSVLSELPEAERERAMARLSKGDARPTRKTPRDGTEVPNARTPRGGSPIPSPSGRPAPSQTLLLAGIGGALVALIVIAFLVLGGGPKPDREVTLPKHGTPPVVPDKPVVSDREKTLQAAIDKARDAARAGVDIDAQIRLWDAAVAAAERTTHIEEVTRERALVQNRRKDAYAQELARLVDSIDGIVRGEEFKKALDLLASARKRHDHPDWTQPIDRKTEEIKKAEAEGVPFRQAADGDSLVCFEAEHFHAKADLMNHAWTLVSAPADFGGTGAMAILPNIGTGSLKDFATSSPRMDYRIRFEKAGKHFVWIRGCAESGTDDSIHVGLDGKDVKSSTAVSISIGTKWGWTSKIMGGGAAYVDIPSPGLHVVNIWMREDGAVVDRVVITTNPKYAPKDAGPPESSR